MPILTPATLAMQSYEIYALILKGLWVFFVFAFGACIGSLINVLVYRLPLGLGVVTPPSRCPHCETRLTWRENIPILGWILLRGKCRFCKSRISPEYPIVEAFVAALFAGLFVLWYLVPKNAALVWWGPISWSAVKPEWFMNDPVLTWPTFIIMLLLLGSLVAMTLIDARTFTIPIELALFTTCLGVIVHPLHAAWVQWSAGTPGGMGMVIRHVAPGATWSMPTPAAVASWFGLAGTHLSIAWAWIGGSIGAVLGLGISLLLLRLRLIRHSFADYQEWEDKALKEAEAQAAESAAPATPENPTHIWIQYPHARREMIRELAFLAAPVVLGLLTGWFAASQAESWGPAPLWLDVLAGALSGYLIGAGLVWLVRIGGTLGFGREAMGLGDVHLMGGVGACIGWVDAVLAFFLAALVGVAWFGITLVGGRKFQRALPYGPYLAVATLLVIVFKPYLEWGLTFILQVPPGEPPINIP